MRWKGITRKLKDIILRSCGTCITNFLKKTISLKGFNQRSWKWNIQAQIDERKLKSLLSCIKKNSRKWTVNLQAWRNWPKRTKLFKLRHLQIILGQYPIERNFKKRAQQQKTKVKKCPRLPAIDPLTKGQCSKRLKILSSKIAVWRTLLRNAFKKKVFHPRILTKI